MSKGTKKQKDVVKNNYTVTNKESGWSKTWTPAKTPNKEWSNTVTSKQYLTTPGQRTTANNYYSALTKAEGSIPDLKKFTNPYGMNLNNSLNRINNSKFSYSVNKDALYNQYKNQYQAMGNVAMQEAQANATALTGGFSNSYAQTAGQNAYNSYLSQLQNIIPQLYSQARSIYDTDLSNEYNKANLYSSLGTQKFNEYQAQAEQGAANRDYAYNKWRDYVDSTVKETSNTTGGSYTYSQQKSGSKIKNKNKTSQKVVGSKKKSSKKSTKKNKKK